MLEILVGNPKVLPVSSWFVNHFATQILIIFLCFVCCLICAYAANDSSTTLFLFPVWTSHFYFWLLLKFQPRWVWSLYTMLIQHLDLVHEEGKRVKNNINGGKGAALPFYFIFVLIKICLDTSPFLVALSIIHQEKLKLNNTVWLKRWILHIDIYCRLIRQENLFFNSSWGKIS